MKFSTLVVVALVAIAWATRSAVVPWYLYPVEPHYVTPHTCHLVYHGLR